MNVVRFVQGDLKQQVRFFRYTEALTETSSFWVIFKISVGD